MKNWLKKVLSLLIAIALLVSAGVLAFAEETGEPIDNAVAEDAVQTDAEEAAARQAAEEAARKAAEEEAAQKAAEEEAARKAAEEEAARQAAEEEAARQAAEEEAAQNANTSEQDNETVPSNNNEETSETEETSEKEDTSETEEPSETEAPAADEDDDSDGEVIEIDGWGYVDPEIIPEYLPEITTEIKFPEATELKLNQAVSGSVDAENNAEYIFVCGSSKTVVLSLNASSEDVKVEINQKAVKLTKDENVTSEFSASCELNVSAGNEYNIVLTSSVPLSYKLIVGDANTAQEENTAESGNAGEAGTNEQSEEDRSEPSGSGKPSINNNEETATTEENSENDIGNNNETAEEEVPPMTGWISVNAGSYGIGDTVILTAESDSELGDMVAWQTKVGNDGSWKGAGYGKTLTVELTEENNNSAYRFRMEDGNYSAEYVLTAAGEETGETEEPEETETVEGPGTEEAETAELDEDAETEEAEAAEPAEDTETEEAEEPEETEERKVSFSYFWDDEEPSIGSVVHMKATVIGYDNLDYVLQWQYSEDPDTFGWTDYPGANDETFDLQITEENNNFFWRVSVFLDEEAE